MWIKHINLFFSLNDLSDKEYVPIRVRGTFDHSQEMYIGPKKLNDNNPFPNYNTVGYLVVTPFKLVDRE